MVMPASDAFRVTFVCTGNICRSPMAEAIFRDVADKAGLSDRVIATSSGTGDWHVGERADGRTISALERAGYDGASHRARQFTVADFDSNDLVIALDRSHERILQQWSRSQADSERIALLLSLGGKAHADNLDVPDPYYSDERMFDDVLRLIESAVTELFHQLEPALRSARER